MAGGDITEEEHEVILYEEEVVVDKQVVPKERVRLDKDVVTEEQPVTEQVRKEQIEVDGDARRAASRHRPKVAGRTASHLRSAHIIHRKGVPPVSLMFAAVDIGASLQQALDTFFAFLPRLLGFLIVLAIGFIVAKVVKSLLIKLLGKVGLDRAMHSGSVGQYVNKAAPDLSPSRIIGTIAFWFIFLGALSIAVSQLGIAALNTFVQAISAYLPNVIAAVLIFVIAAWSPRPSAASSPAPWATPPPARSSARSSRCWSWRSPPS